MKRIKNFEEACKQLGLDPNALPDVSNLPEKHQKAIVANYKLTIICEALNNGWTPDWSDQYQPKWQPWFKVKASKNNPGGSGLVYHYAFLWCSYTDVSSRLCLQTRELAEYVGKTKAIKELYEDYFLIK